MVLLYETNGGKMKFCPDCDPDYSCCDFCKWYSFNGDNTGAYTGNGWCNLHWQPMHPGSVCDNFHCEDLKDKE